MSEFVYTIKQGEQLSGSIFSGRRKTNLQRLPKHIRLTKKDSTKISPNQLSQLPTDLNVQINLCLIRD